MFYNLRSTLGNFLRRDREDWQRDRHGSAKFGSQFEAEQWVRLHYGPNGLKFFFAVPVGGEDED